MPILRMHLTRMMGQNLSYLFLLSTGILAVLPAITSPTEVYATSSSSSKNSTIVDIKEILPRKRKLDGPSLARDNGWSCPHVTDIAEISCSCDLPHTVRCRGWAKFPEIILRLTHELSHVDESKRVSLLDLAIHKLGKLPPESFEGLPLLGLVISTAGLHTVDKESFVGIEDTLGALGLPSNELTSVPADAIKFLRQLHRLDLSDNSLNVLNSHEFPTLLQIRNVNLAGNKMRVIEAEAFSRLPQLRSLNLGRNQLDISQLNERTLWGLHYLEELSLEANLIKGPLTALFLQSAPGLVSLDLSHNAVTKISFGALKALVNLRHLDLSHNDIDIIEDHAFKHLGSLEHLDMSHNNIVAVSGSSLSHLPLLTSLNLADNSLFAVTADLLHQLPNLTMIDLAANDISLLQPDVFNYTPKLRDLSLADNPIHCDCSLTWLLNWLRTHVQLSDEHKGSVVCATPPNAENAPLVELESKELVCNKDAPDYYLDAATEYEDLYELRISDAEVSLLAASWMDADEANEGSSKSSSPAGVQLVWRVDQRAVPYICQAVHIYERETIKGNVHEILAEKVSVNCSSEGQVNPNQIVVTVPAGTLKEGAVYRYCLVLLEKGTSDKEGVLPGCSEALVLEPPLEEEVDVSHNSAIASLTAGQMSNSLIIQTRVAPIHEFCKYIIVLVNRSKVAQIKVLNCTDVRLTLNSVPPSDYMVCGSLIPSNWSSSLPVHKSTLNFRNLTVEELQEVFTNSGNASWNALIANFDSCASVTITNKTEGWNTAPLFTLLFTIPGIAFLVTLYLIGRRIWKGGGVLWKWDPRDQKSAKYFLYTGESGTPCQSVDHLDAPLPESTTPV